MNASPPLKMALNKLRRPLRSLRAAARSALVKAQQSSTTVSQRIFDLLFQKRPDDQSHPPVIINSYNRLDSLKLLVNWLESAGVAQIIILDNCSTYKPLLDYLDSLSHRVVKLRENLGPDALWKSPIWREVRRAKFVYTDPDVVPCDSCPKDLLERMSALLDRYPLHSKVGLGLRIDDLPAHYSLRDKVIQWEGRFWESAIEPDVYEATVDTTFAMYRPYGGRGGQRSLRLGGNCVARHTPWYADSSNPSAEELNYQNSIAPEMSWWTQSDRASSIRRALVGN